MSAPAGPRRNPKPVQDTSAEPKFGRRAGGQGQSFTSTLATSSPGKHAQSGRSLRRRKTVQDLRSSDSTSKSKISNDKSSQYIVEPKACPRVVSTAVPLTSRTNQDEIQTWNHKPPAESRKTTTLKSTSDADLDPHKIHERAPAKLNHADISMNEEDVRQISRAASHDTEMIDCASIARPVTWVLKNVFDFVDAPQDFLKIFTRSDGTPAKGLNPHTKRLSVSTRWKGISDEIAEDLFCIHNIFIAALRSLISPQAEGLFSRVKQNFSQKVGESAYLDGFRVSILDHWIHVDREWLIEEMIKLGHDFFSYKEHQPRRSALMQLYLSSTDCFLDYDKYEKRIIPTNTGIQIRTFYDQLSCFETPVVRAATFSDYVRFLNLNPNPREDEELLIIPQYNRDGIFVQTPYPDNVNYILETPIGWLGWDNAVKGFRGRVPTYSALADDFNLERNVIEGGCITHVLEIIIAATLWKHCSTGSAHFGRLVRTQLTFYILSKQPSSVIHSVYGVNQWQESSTSPYPRSSASSSHQRPSQSQRSSPTNAVQEKQAEDSFSLPKRATPSHASPQLEQKLAEGLWEEEEPIERKRETLTSRSSNVGENLALQEAIMKSYRNEWSHKEASWSKDSPNSEHIVKKDPETPYPTPLSPPKTDTRSEDGLSDDVDSMGWSGPRLVKKDRF